jgi:hypothetical protein
MIENGSWQCKCEKWNDPATERCIWCGRDASVSVLVDCCRRSLAPILQRLEQRGPGVHEAFPGEITHAVLYLSRAVLALEERVRDLEK